MSASAPRPLTLLWYTVTNYGKLTIVKASFVGSFKEFQLKSLAKFATLFLISEKSTIQFKLHIFLYVNLEAYMLLLLTYYFIQWTFHIIYLSVRKNYLIF